MDDKILRYRKRHKKCKFCKYLITVIPKIDCVPIYTECIAKDKVIVCDSTYRPFCSCYTVKEDF